MSTPASSQDLVNAALAAHDPYAAAGVYETGGTRRRRQLEALMFSERRNALMFARWERTPSAVLQALAASRDDAVKVRLDRNPGTPERALTSLYQGERQPALLGLIAQHRHAPARVLEQMVATATDVGLLKAVSANPAAGAAALRALDARMPGVFDAELASNAATPPDVLERIYGRSNPFVRAAVVAHAGCPRSVVQLAGNEQQVVVLRHLARDRRVDVQLLTRLAGHEDAALRRSVAANPTLPAALVEHMVDDASALVRRALAAREDLSPAAMERLAQDADAWTRGWLARNPHTPLALLQTFAADAETEVRRAVARNPACPLPLLERLAADPEAWVRAAVAYQPNASAELLQRLAEDSAVDVLSGVAAHPRSAQPILHRLAQSDEADVRRGVIHNPGARRDVLLPLLEDPYFLHRLLLVGNAALTARDKWGLWDDPDPAVRFEVFRWFAATLQPGVRHQPVEVVFGITKEKDREDIGCSEAGCGAR